MKSKMVRALSGAMVIVLFLLLFPQFGCGGNSGYAAESNNRGTAVAGTPLPIPPMLENLSADSEVAEFQLNIQKGISEFFPGIYTETYGYNGDYLGPTIRARKGQKVKVHVQNDLHEYTTVHWHGMILPGEMDGGPHQVILPRGNWNPEWDVIQPAATLWYHPHGHGTTGYQVYKGLAGFFILDDDESDDLNLPSSYGVNDIPIVVQDRRFTSDGGLIYKNDMFDVMQGVMGNVLLVNGAIAPFLDVSTIEMRFRLLNGSNARSYKFRLSDGAAFHVIASDGGLLEAPVKRTSIPLSPGERVEIIVDFSKYEVGTSISLVTDEFDVLRFNVNSDAEGTTSMPDSFFPIEKIPETDVDGRRFFALEGMGFMVSINGRQMDMNRIDERMKLNSTEIWTITNNPGMMGGGMMGRGGMGGGMMGGMGNIPHPFHAHGVQFQILDRDGRTPPEYERGWKDTVSVEADERVRVIMRYLYKGVFMYHCHILEHEDQGMMGQFEVR